jgi:hypothetical protein
MIDPVKEIVGIPLKDRVEKLGQYQIREDIRRYAMNCLYKIGVSVLIVAVINLQVPVVALAVEASLPDKSDGITKNAPEMLATPEVNQKSHTWLWWVLGAVAVGAAVAAGGGGGGGGGGSSSSSGTLNIGW